VAAAGYNDFAREHEMPAFCRLWSCDPIVRLVVYGGVLIS
jgi:hypothetical protein